MVLHTPLVINSTFQIAGLEGFIGNCLFPSLCADLRNSFQVNVFISWLTKCGMSKLYMFVDKFCRTNTGLLTNIGFEAGHEPATTSSVCLLRGHFCSKTFDSLKLMDVQNFCSRYFAAS